MTKDEAINLINNAKSLVDVFPDLGVWKNQYKKLAMLIHPDHCNTTEAEQAFKILAEFVSKIEKGSKHNDDSGEIKYKIIDASILDNLSTIKSVLGVKELPIVTELILKGKPELNKISLYNYNILTNLKDKSSEHFKKYLPISITKISDNELKIILPYRAVPLSSLGVLPQEHVNWILSRMLEFSSWLNQIKFVHGGINPDSIYIIPENHGMICTSFYHMSKLDDKMKTISGKYSQFYPSKVFTSKKATSDIDIELSKRSAIYLLGDTSGAGIKLKKTHNVNILDFIFKNHNIPLNAYKEYREILNKNYDMKKFHVLKA